MRLFDHFAFWGANGDLYPSGLDGSIRAVIQVFVGVLWVQGELVQGEAHGRGDRMGPGNILIEANGYAVGIEQASAHDVHFAGNRGVNQMKAGGPAPRVVGVA